MCRWGDYADRIALAVSVYDLYAVACIVHGYGEAEAMAVWEVVEHVAESDALMEIKMKMEMKRKISLVFS